jgi:hypothetical protein
MDKDTGIQLKFDMLLLFGYLGFVKHDSFD